MITNNDQRVAPIHINREIYLSTPLVDSVPMGLNQVIIHTPSTPQSQTYTDKNENNKKENDPTRNQSSQFNRRVSLSTPPLSNVPTGLTPMMVLTPSTPQNRTNTDKKRSNKRENSPTPNHSNQLPKETLPISINIVVGPEEPKPDNRTSAQDRATTKTDNLAAVNIQTIPTTKVRNTTQNQSKIGENNALKPTISAQKQRDQESPGTVTVVTLASSEEETSSTEDTHSHDDQPDRQRKNILNQPYSKTDMTLQEEIGNTTTNRPTTKQDPLPAISQRTFSSQIRSALRAGSSLIDDNESTTASTSTHNSIKQPPRTNHTYEGGTLINKNQGLLKYIEEQNSTVSPPRPHHHPDTINPRETTGVVIFRPCPTSTVTRVDYTNNQTQKHGRTTAITQQATHTPSQYPITRKKCEGIIYRLTPVGRSDHPGHQAGTCYTHQRNHNNSQRPVSEATEWALQQTRDSDGNNNFHQDAGGNLTTTNLGHPHCNYCKLPSHSRQKCAFRLRDLEHNIDTFKSWIPIRYPTVRDRSHLSCSLMGLQILIPSTSEFMRLQSVKHTKQNQPLASTICRRR